MTGGGRRCRCDDGKQFRSELIEYQGSNDDRHGSNDQLIPYDISFFRHFHRWLVESQ